MQGSKTKSGLADAKGNGKAEAKGNGRGTPPKGGKTASKPAVPKAATATHGAPPRAAEKSPGSADRKAPPKSAARITTPPTEKQGKAAKPPQELPAVKPSQELQVQAQLAVVQEELKKAKEQLVEKEKERGRAFEELGDAKKAADEATAKLQEALDVKSRAVEASEEDELQRKLKSMQGQQEADAAALRSTVEQLEKARYELADAIDAKNAALCQADDAMRASEVNAEKVELLNAEVERLKGLLDSEVESKSKEATARIRQLEAENSALKVEFENTKLAEERVVELECVVEKIKLDLADAKMAGSKSDEMADEWKRKAHELEVRLEEAEQSNSLKGESLDSAMKELDATKTLIQDKESEVAVLQDRVRSLEDEVARQKGDIEVSTERLDTAEKEVVDLTAEVEGLRLKLQTAEEEKIEALNNDKHASSEVETLTEQKNKLAKELEASKDEVEKLKKAMEGLASALHEMSAESREAQEKYLIKQEEIEHARAQVEELNASLQNTKDKHEVMLDEANYEKVCLKKSVERLEAEAKNASEEWQSKELSFVSSIKNSEEEVASIRVHMDKTTDKVKDKENENAELLEKMKHLEAQLMEASKTSEEAKAETFQWKEKLLDKENELQNIKQENDELQAKESDASEKIKELSSLLAKTKDGSLNGSNKEEDNKGVSDDDEPVVVVAKMWENNKVTDYDSSKEKENDGESEVDLGSNRGDVGLDSSELQPTKTNNGGTSPTKQQKKKPLLKKFGGLLKKKSQN